MSSFDRIKPPKQRPDLFSSPDPSRPPGEVRVDEPVVEPAQEETETGLLTVECGHCGDVCPMTLTAALSRALPVAVVVPWRRHPVFAVCPCGQRRAWLKPRVSLPGR